MRPRPVARAVATAVIVTVLASCSTSQEGPSVPPPPNLDQELVDIGETLYEENCASCHRADLSGDPNWKTPNADGSYPPPPHDSSGHTWHHSDEVLLTLIRDGSDFPETRMPRFGQTLGDEEIRAIIEYLKANWGEEERAYQWQITARENQR